MPEYHCIPAQKKRKGAAYFVPTVCLGKFGQNRRAYVGVLPGAVSAKRRQLATAIAGVTRRMARFSVPDRDVFSAQNSPKIRRKSAIAESHTYSIRRSCVIFNLCKKVL